MMQITFQDFWINIFVDIIVCDEQCLHFNLSKYHIYRLERDVMQASNNLFKSLLTRHSIAIIKRPLAFYDNSDNKQHRKHIIKVDLRQLSLWLNPYFIIKVINVENISSNVRIQLRLIAIWWPISIINYGLLLLHFLSHGILNITIWRLSSQTYQNIKWWLCFN